MSKTRLFMIIAVILLSLILTWTVVAANSTQGTLLVGEGGKGGSVAKLVNVQSESNGIEAVSEQYSFSSSTGTYTEIVSGTVHGNASNDDTSFNAIDLGFTFHFNNVDYTQVSIQSNGFIAMGPSVSSSYVPLSTGSTNNVIAALGRDIEGNDTTSTLTSKVEGTAPNRVFTVQWSHYKRYGTSYVNDDFNFQIKIHETSGLVKVVYGPFTVAYVASPPTVQVGLRGASNADFNNRTTTTDWTATTAGTSNTDAMVLTDLIFPPNGLTFDWTPVSGAFLSPASQSGSICKGSDVVYNLSLINATGTAVSFDLSYSSIWPYVGPTTSPVIPSGSTWDFQVTVHIPWSVNAGDIDTLTVNATGGGYADSAQLITTASELSTWADFSNAPRPVRAPSIVYKDAKLYKIGGYDGVAQPYLDIYDIATDTWTPGADMPAGRYWIDCEAIGDGIFCAGGYTTSGQTTLYRYDIPSNTWSTLTPMSAYRYSYASVVMNGKYYVIGGYGAAYTATLWEYDPVTDTWNYGLPSMATGRRYHSAGVIGGKIYVAGGYSPSYLSSVEIYDPVANAWTAGPSMPTTWLGAADGVYADRYLLLAGGDDNSTATASNLVWVLDALTGTWSAGPNMAHAVYGAEGVGDASGVWVVTGRLYDGAYSYSPFTSKISQCDTTCTPVSGLDFTWDPLVPWTNFPVSFDASFTAGSPAINFDWTFGDGGTGQGELTSHTYLLPNTYTVGLTATNCDGASTATASHNVNVILPPTITVDPTSLTSTQFSNTVTTQPLEICNIGDDPLSWEITETDGGLATGVVNTAASTQGTPQDIIRLEDDSVDCAAYENYTGYEPAEVAAACPAAVPQSLTSNPEAPTDIGYALDIGYISDNFVTFTLNNFAGQTVVAQNATAFYGMDFDPSAQVLYALNDATDMLGTIDLTTGAFTALVPAPPGGGAANWTGLSIDPTTGVFYASTATDLYTIDPATGITTLVGPFGTTLMIDIAVNANSEMYGHDIGTDSIYSINTTTGVATLIGLTGFNANYAQGLDFDNDDGTLYIFLYIGSGANLYGTVNLTTGAVTQISNTPQGEFEGAVQIPGTPLDLPWLSESPITGTLSGGLCQTVDVTFDSTGLAVGQYLGGLDVSSNDPINPTVPVPVTLNVFDPNVNYGTSAKFAPPDVLHVDPIHYTVIITNTGNVAGLDTLMTDVIPAGASYVPNSVTCSSGNCWFDSGANTVFWNGQVGPGGMFNSLPSTPDAHELAGGNNEPDASWPGPDGYGYVGSSVPFNWIDISTSGTPIAGFSDDNFVGPFPIGFNFNFYGEMQSQFYASSNGFISFGAGFSTLTNQCPLPSSSSPDNLIAMMWDDLNFNVSGNAYYQTFGTCPVGSGACLVVEYANTAHYGGSAGSAGTWEAVLFPNGDVILQYLDPGVETGSGSTEGIEDTNYAGDYGLTYACDAAGTLAPNTAALFTNNATPPNPVTIEFDVMATACPSVIDNLAVLTDPQLPAPVQLTASTNVTCATFPDVDVTPTQLTETLFPDEQATQQLNVCNVGDAPLDWTLVESAPPKSPQVILFDNGPLVTHPGGGGGGADASALQTALGMSVYGFGHALTSGYRMADDFTITDPAGWQIDQVTFFAYQTGSGTSCTINHVNYRIWDGPPSDPGSTVVFGDTSTNRLVSCSWSNIYRVLDTSLMNTDRPVMADIASAGVTLPAGTYWIDWQTGGTLGSGPWAPPISILGQTTTGNGLQWDPTVNLWNPAVDSGTLTPQGLPFIIEGSIVGGTDVPWLSETPTSGTVQPSACTVVDVTFDSTGLTPDTYTAALLVNSNDPDEPTVNVPVTLVVEANVPDIVVTAPPLELTLVLGTSGTLNMSIGNTGNADLTWSMADGVTWLSEAPDAGTTLPGDTTPVVVTFNSAGLAPGDHMTNLVITSNDPDEPSVSLPVTLTVIAPDIDVTAPPLVMTLYPNQTGSLTFTIANLGTSDLTWNLADDVDWLSEAPISGTIIPNGSTVVTVTFDSSGLAAGTYTATITITSDDPDEPSVTLNVTLTVINYGFFLPIIQR